MRRWARTHWHSVAGLLLATSLVTLTPSMAPADDARLIFDSEFIAIVVEPDSLRIEGHYRFVVPQPGPGFQNLLYPYPADSLLGGARTVSLQWRTGDQPWRDLEFRELPDGRGARWPVPLPPAGLVEVRTVYRQERLAAYGRYIVTTTRGWEHPLRQARFEIHLPPGARPLTFSHPFARLSESGENIFLFENKEFYPEQDIRFTWQP